MPSTDARTHPVSTPLFICDAFADDRFKGNSAGVCLVPTTVYCMEWSAVNSLEASFGRGQPEPESTLTEEEREAAAAKYAKECNDKMGRAFHSVAMEMNLSETAFVYRLPASRVKEIQQKIKAKAEEFESEYEEKVRIDDMERRRSSMFNMTNTDEPASPKDDLPRSPGLIPSTSFSMGSFGASFLDTRGLSNSMKEADSASRPRRLHTQWFGLRWFTPTEEMALCGHATMAAAHVIFETSRLCHYQATRHLVGNVPVEFFVPAQTDVLCFVTQSGIISVRRKDETEVVYRTHRDNANALETYEVHFPATEAVSVKDKVPKPMFEDLVTALGLPYGEDGIDDIAVSPSVGYYVARLNSARYIAQCKPNEAALRAVFASPEFKEAMKAHPKELVAPKGVVVTARNDGEIMSGPAKGAQIVTRFFAPWVGVPEDPVTGSAHTSIVPYWLRIMQNGKYKVGDKLECYQASSRGGSMTCIIIGKKADRIAMIGSAVTFMRGNATFPVED